jgi:hypothetical protein
MVAIVVPPLLQLPPDVTSLNIVVSPEHTDNVPVIVAGSGLTVSTAVAIHPVANV